MDWVIRLLPGRKVALGIAAIGRTDLQRIISIDMALAALHGCVLVRQRETGRTVIEFAVGPGRNRVARRTRCRSGGEA